MDEFKSLVINNTGSSARVVQITDCHLGASAEEQLLGLNTRESLQDVLSFVGAQEAAFDLLLTTGDISNDYTEASYSRFLNMIAEQVQQPLAWLPGNHDLPSAMESAMEQARGESMVKVVEVGQWQLILLDSSVRGFEHGDLSESELAFLDQALAAKPDHHALIFLHHQPVPVGSAWVDQYVVRSASAFFEVIDRHPQVKAVSWGHVHQEFQAERKGVQLWATPSTCVQFTPQHDEFSVDHAMPAYRWYELHDDGRIETGVSRITEKAYDIDFASAGY